MQKDRLDVRPCVALIRRGALIAALAGSPSTIYAVRAQQTEPVDSPAEPSDGTGEGILLSIDEENARYPLTIDPIVQRGYLKTPNAETLDLLGWSVGVDDDTIVVGAIGEDSSASGVNGDATDNGELSSGAAYVFQKVNGVWTQQAYLKASNPEAGDLFGVAVAICGDLIVVGASGEDSAIPGDPNDNAATSAGAAYVYARNGGSWVQVAYLKASNPDPNDSFGREVAVSGDIVTVTAPAEDSDSTGVNGNQDNDPSTTNDTGAAYVFVRDGGAWSQQAYLKASNAGSLDDFGWSVAASGETVVVGAFKEDSGAAGVDGNQADNSAFNSGAAYVFVRNGSSWSQQAYLKASNPGLTDNFGTSVAASADTVLVGAPFERSSATGVDGDQSDDSLSSAGAVYVFVRAGNTWSQEAYLKASNTGSGDAFGQSVSASGNHAVIGAYWEDSATTGVDGNGADDTATDAGAAYVFHRLGAGWRQIAYLKASNTDPSDRFGQEVSISKDTVVVTAPYEDSDATSVDGVQGNAGSDVGAAYALRIGPQGKMRRVDEVHCNGSFVEPVRSGGTVTLQGLVAEEPELRLDLPPEDPASSRLRGPSGALGMVWLGTRVVAHGERSLVTDVVERRYVRLVERSGTAAIGTADFRIELPPESRARRFFVQTAVLGPGRVLSPVVQLPGSEEHGALGRLR